MNASTWLLPERVLFVATGIAVGSVVFSMVGLIVAWKLRRRSLPVQHGVLLAALGVVAVLPGLIPSLQQFGLGWRMLPERTAVPLAITTPPPTVRQPMLNSPTLELLADGSLGADGMTVAEVMAMYGDSARAEVGPTLSPREHTQNTRIPVAWICSSLCLIWLAGFGISMFRALRAWRSIRRLSRGADLIDDPAVLELLANCAADMGLKRLPPVVSSRHVTVPHVSGLWRPFVVLPAGLVDADDESLRGILLHELAHIHRRDLWVGRLQRLVAALYWWNPLVHRLNMRLAEFREDLCDNYVLAHVPDRRGYAEALVELAAQAVGPRPLPTMGLLSRKSNRLSGRIQRILEEDRPMATRLGGVSKVLLLAFVFALGAGSTLFVIQLPHMLPETRADVTSVPEDPVVETASRAEPTISLVNNESAAIPRISPSAAADWDAVALPPNTTSAEIAGLNAESAAGELNPFPVAEISSAPVAGEAESPRFDLEPAPRLDEPQPDLFIPAVDPGSAPEDFAQATGLHDIDPFGNAAPVGEPLTLPETAVESSESWDSAEAIPPPPKALVLVELAANPDGSVKQLRYLTEDLGNDDAAFQSLEKQIIAWAGQYAGGDLTVQIVADPQLRYEHVARITKLCSPLVTRVVLVEADIKARVTITVGFVRDAQGRSVIATPVVFWQDEVVRLGELQSRLESWIHSSTRRTSSPNQPPLGPASEALPALHDVTLVLHCDKSVEYTVVESIMKEARQAGFEHFAIREIDVVTEEAVIGVVTEVDTENPFAQISIGADAGLRPRMRVCVYRGPVGATLRESDKFSELEVISVDAASARCRIWSMSPGISLAVGDVVRTKDVALDSGTPMIPPGNSF